MMQRRSFLGAMLAAFAAPAVMSSAIERGVLMPAPKKIWTPGDEMLMPDNFAGVLMPANFAGPMLKLFTASGILLAEVQMSKKQESLFDYGRIVALDLVGQAGVVATGHAARYELELAEGLRHCGKVGEGGLHLNSNALTAGQLVSINNMSVRGDAKLKLMKAWDDV